MDTTTAVASTSSILPLDAASPSESYAFLKLEDLHNPPTPAPSSPSFDESLAMSGTTDSLASPPPPVIVHSKPAKKRKSWGQELPEPKTNLPPRKRAKTDDEKEQRRIERIKRNRAAAHNSRERKRQETETLAVALARANAELDAYRRLHGPLPASVVLPEVTLSTTDSAPTPVPSLVDSRSSVDATSPSSPVDRLFDGDICIKQEPADTLFPAAAHLFDNLDAKSSSLLRGAPLDSTQHSAVMLCDLQCRSKRNPRSNTTDSALMAVFWTRLFLSLLSLQLRTTYQTLLMAMWSTSPSRMARMTQASTRPSTSPSTTSSTTPRLSRSIMALAQPRAATAMLARGRGACVAALPRSSVAMNIRRGAARSTADHIQTPHPHVVTSSTAMPESAIETERRTSHDEDPGTHLGSEGRKGVWR